MLRLRKSDGTTQLIPTGWAVEYVDTTTDKIAAVVYKGADGSVNVLDGACQSSRRYEKSFGLEFCKPINLSRLKQ